MQPVTVPSWASRAILIALVAAAIMLICAQFSPSKSLTATATPERIAELEDNEKTLDLAIEFGFDPIIVKIVRQLSAEEFKKRACQCKTWRFVRSDYDLSYLLLSIIQIESRGDYRAFNPAGPAYGLTQFVMSTARQYDKNVSQGELLTIPKHLQLATQHFVDLLELAGGNHLLAVAAWNQGASVITRSAALGNSPGGQYAQLVLTRASMRNAQP